MLIASDCLNGHDEMLVVFVSCSKTDLTPKFDSLQDRFTCITILIYKIAISPFIFFSIEKQNLGSISLLDRFH